jgi:DNA polymerase-3 subunit gamma/tau
MTLLRLYTFRPALPSDSSVSFPSPSRSVVKTRAFERPATALVQDKAPDAAGVVVEAEGVSDESSSSLDNQLVDRPEEGDIESSSSVKQATSDDWHEILAALKLSGMARELGQHCEMRRLEGAQIELCLSPAHRHLQIKPAQDKLQQSLAEYFGRTMQLIIRLDEVAGDTPAAAAQRRRDELQEQAMESVEQDGFVREVIDLFDATLIESSIKPV